MSKLSSIGGSPTPSLDVQPADPVKPIDPVKPKAPKATRNPDRPKDLSKVNKNIPLEKIMVLKEKGLNNKQVAKILDCSTQNIHRRCEQWKEEFKTIDFYRENKLAILDAIQFQILSSIDQADLKRMALRDRITAYGILFDKARIVSGDDVVKIDIRLLHGDLDEIKRKKEELMSKLTSLSPDHGAQPQP